MRDNNDMIVLDDELIKEKIHIIRWKQVMLDFDLAEIYGYSTKAFNQQVQRNIERFPGGFMFSLTNEEVLDLVSRSQLILLFIRLKKSMEHYVFIMVVILKKASKHLRVLILN